MSEQRSHDPGVPQVPQPPVWPDSLMIRDTGIIPDDGGGRIYTTVGFGYVKRRYVRDDLADAERMLEAERLVAEALSACPGAPEGLWMVRATRFLNKGPKS